MSDALPMYVVCFNPSDFPNKYVVRLHLVEQGRAEPTREHFTADTLDEARSGILVFAEELEYGEPVMCIARDPKDDKVIVETWF